MDTYASEKSFKKECRLGKLLSLFDVLFSGLGEEFGKQGFRSEIRWQPS